MKVHRLIFKLGNTGLKSQNKKEHYLGKLVALLDQQTDH